MAKKYFINRVEMDRWVNFPSLEEERVVLVTRVGRDESGRAYRRTRVYKGQGITRFLKVGRKAFRFEEHQTLCLDNLITGTAYPRKMTYGA